MGALNMIFSIPSAEVNTHSLSVYLVWMCAAAAARAKKSSPATQTTHLNLLYMAPNGIRFASRYSVWSKLYTFAM